jgi:hypothetical protein
MYFGLVLSAGVPLTAGEGVADVDMVDGLSREDGLFWRGGGGK